MSVKMLMIGEARKKAQKFVEDGFPMTIIMFVDSFSS
jgi:hypothetical protein